MNDLTMDMLRAVRSACDKAKLNPAKPEDLMVVLQAIGELMMAMVLHADPGVDGIVINPEGTSIIRGEEVYDVFLPPEEKH